MAVAAGRSCPLGVCITESFRSYFRSRHPGFPNSCDHVGFSLRPGHAISGRRPAEAWMRAASWARRRDDLLIMKPYWSAGGSHLSASSVEERSWREALDAVLSLDFPEQSPSDGRGPLAAEEVIALAGQPEEGNAAGLGGVRLPRSVTDALEASLPEGPAPALRLPPICPDLDFCTDAPGAEVSISDVCNLVRPPRRDL